MHRKIKHFVHEGEAASVVGLRERVEHVVLTELKDKGYIPILGLGPYFSTTRDWERGIYKFVVSAYGVFVGSEGANAWMGVDAYNGQHLPLLTPPSTSSEFSTSSV